MGNERLIVRRVYCVCLVTANGTADRSALAAIVYCRGGDARVLDWESPGA